MSAPRLASAYGATADRQRRYASVVKLHAEGLSNKLISARLGISLRQVHRALQAAQRAKNQRTEGLYLFETRRRRA